MKKIAIIGGGIIGLTLATYLDSKKFEVTLFDEGVGQATGASAGIISPWLSKRRNKKWYQLAQDGAAFFPKLISDLSIPNSVYSTCGTLLLREESSLASLAALAEQRRKAAPEIGNIHLLSGVETQQKSPLLKPQASLYISGGGRLDGAAFLEQATKVALNKDVRLIREKAFLKQQQANWIITSDTQQFECDYVAVTAGPFTKKILGEVGYSVDIRPQKGQLLVYETGYHESGQWPVAMLDGEADFIPFANGKLLIGATHENESAWDLTPTSEARQQLVTSVNHFMTDAITFLKEPAKQLVGTRAYTTDFAPFFGPLPEAPTLVAASGLGSSGLTTGPYIGYLLSQYFNKGYATTEQYQKPIAMYISRD